MVMDAPYPFSQPGIVPRAGRIYQGVGGFCTHLLSAGSVFLNN